MNEEAQPMVLGLARVLDSQPDSGVAHIVGFNVQRQPNHMQLTVQQTIVLSQHIREINKK